MKQKVRLLLSLICLTPVIDNKMIELLQYFDEDQLQLLKFDGPATTTPPTAPSSTASS